MINNHSLAHIQRSADRLEAEIELVINLVMEENASIPDGEIPYGLTLGVINRDIDIVQRYAPAKKYMHLRKLQREHSKFRKWLKTIQPKIKKWREMHEALLNEIELAHALRPFKGADDE